MMSEKKQEKEMKGFDFGAAIATGVSLGLVFGTALGNLVMGLTAGLLLATLANAYHEREQGKPGGRVAFVISIVSLLIWGIIVVFWL